MGKYKERKQNDKTSSPNKALGFLLIFIGVLGFVISCVPNFIVGDFILGAFGLCAYPLFLALGLLGLAKTMRLVYKGDSKYAFRIFLTTFFALCLIHSIFSLGALNSLAFGKYIADCFKMGSGVTVGGVALGIICGAIASALGGVGACVVWGISAVICCGATIDYAIYCKNQNALTQKNQRQPAENYFDEVVDPFEEKNPEFQAVRYNDGVTDVESDVDAAAEVQTDDKNAHSILFGNSNENSSVSFEENDTYHNQEAFDNSNRSAKDILFGQNPVPNIYNSTDAQRRAWLGANSSFDDEQDNSNDQMPFNSRNTNINRDTASQTLFGDQKLDQNDEPIDRSRAMDILGMNRAENQNFGSMRGISAFSSDVLSENANLSGSTQNADSDRFDRRGPSIFGENGDNAGAFGRNYGEENEGDFSQFGRNRGASNLGNFNDGFSNFGRGYESSDNSSGDDLSDGSFSNPFRRNVDAENAIRGRNATNFETDLTINQNNIFGESSHFSPRAEQTVMGQVSKPNKPIKRVVKDLKYNPPPISLLNESKEDAASYAKNYEENARIIENKLDTFRIPAKVVGVVRGPTVTQYELSMPAGVPVKKILNYDSDLAMALKSKAGIRIEAPIPGKDAVGIEIPNNPRSTVTFRELVESKEFSNSSAILPVAVGKSISGEVIVKSLAKFVHMLVAGSTGSGKSVFLHSVIMSLMFKMSPAQLRFIMIDPKRVEFSRYNGMPHMMLPNIVSSTEKAINSLSWAVKEMENRYELFAQHKCANIEAFNQCSAVKNHEIKAIPYIVIVVDELAQLMEVSKREVEERIRQLAALARAAGIHLVLATQRPSVDVITGTIKNNLPTRVAFALSNHTDSQTVLDEPGAEKLLGRGDMLFAPQDSNTATRLQGAFLTDEEIEKCIQYIKDNNECDYDSEVEKEIYADKDEQQSVSVAPGPEDKGDMTDELVPEAIKFFIESGKASISMLQRRFYVGFNRAGRIFDQIQKLGYIAPADGAKKNWDIRITMDEYNQIYGDNNG